MEFLRSLPLEARESDTINTILVFPQAFNEVTGRDVPNIYNSIHDQSDELCGFEYRYERLFEVLGYR